MKNLRYVMIRNNKQNVTDLKGKKLFQPLKVTSKTFEYSTAESNFYSMLTEFILSGQAYASSLDPNDRRAVMLVLVTMQKLASSSVAAIRRAINGRLSRITSARRELENLMGIVSQIERAEAFYDNDQLAQLEERIVELSDQLRLMEDEEPRLRQLLDAANKVQQETKINKIISIVEEIFFDRQILFFSEYKATQSLLMSALLQRFGDACVTFINGDNRADDVVDQSGISRSIRESRNNAEDKFNAGKVRFLVSTEAAGEGIDLQEQCYTLIHVDLPWNPMRLHQRVGRLNRYGQDRRVEVVTLRNPDTVESRIWDKLNEKIQNIMIAFREVMEDPEDLFQLVLGMTPPMLFRDLFSQGSKIPQESFSSWFNQKTARFGDKDVIDTVRDLVGHCSKFDYDQVSPQLPRIDLPELKPFFVSMLSLNNRRYKESEDGISFKTPEYWINQVGIRHSYANMVFDRSLRSKDAARRILGVGHKVIEQALNQAQSYDACVSALPKDILKSPIIAFEIVDRITTEGRTVRKALAGIEIESLNGKSNKLLKDWELIMKLNAISEKRGVKKAESELPPEDLSSIKSILENAHQFVKDSLDELNLPFKYPDVEPFAILWPAVTDR